MSCFRGYDNSSQGAVVGFGTNNNKRVEERLGFMQIESESF